MITPWQIDASRLAVLRRLADDLAHEIKNPLHSLVINLEVLRTRVEKGATAAALERAAVLEHEIRRLDSLIDGWLRLVRLPAGHDAATSLALVLDEMVPLLDMRARLARVSFQADDLVADVFTAVPADALRFGLLLIADSVLEDAHQLNATMRLTARSQPEEIHVRIGLACAPAPPHWLTLSHDNGGALRGFVAAAALLDPAGCRVEVETGLEHGSHCAILIRVPRLLFL
jgi:C4-dicarboxylate-specific signal transduction histidine kinase